MKTARIASLAVLLALPAAAQPRSADPAPPAPTRVAPGARLYVEPTEFGMAFSAAILKKHVPVTSVTDKEKADFFVTTTSSSTQEKGAERVTKLLLFGGFAGSGKHFDATVSITNRDGAVVFAHNSKKSNFQSAAENVAGELKKNIERY